MKRLDKLVPTDSRYEPKISALFKWRRVVPDLADHPRALDNWLLARDRAFAIQSLIYDIDTHFERSERIDKSTIDCIWERIMSEVNRATGGNETAVAMVAKIQQYQKYEERIHSFDPISVDEFGEIALAKCADVGLARQIIWGINGVNPSVEYRRFCQIYDATMEIIEDAFDIFEDLSDWNLNFWLYHPKFYGSATPFDSLKALVYRFLADSEENFSKLSADEQGLALNLWCRLRASGNILLTELASGRLQKRLSQFEPVFYADLRAESMRIAHPSQALEADWCQGQFHQIVGDANEASFVADLIAST